MDQSAATIAHSLNGGPHRRRRGHTKHYPLAVFPCQIGTAPNYRLLNLFNYSIGVFGSPNKQPLIKQRVQNLEYAAVGPLQTFVLGQFRLSFLDPTST